MKKDIIIAFVFFAFVPIFASCEKLSFLFEESYPSEHDSKPINSEYVEYIAVFGDIQYYTDDDHKIVLYQNTIDWINEQARNGVAFDCVLHTGDITNSNLSSSYSRFHKATSSLNSSISYFSTIGDHDYQWGEKGIINDRNNTLFSNFMDFPSTKDRVIACYEEGKMENVVYRNEVQGERIDVMCLEFGPRDEVVEWANAYLSDHSDTKFILINHEYLESGGEIRTQKLKCVSRLRNTTYTKPKDLWEKLIFPNDNVLFILCGHVGSLYAVTFTENKAGRLVPQIEHNIQSSNYRYDNWLMLFEFPEKSTQANVSIVNARTGQFYNDTTSLFSFQYREHIPSLKSSKFGKIGRRISIENSKTTKTEQR